MFRFPFRKTGILQYFWCTKFKMWIRNVGHVFWFCFAGSHKQIVFVPGCYFVFFTFGGFQVEQGFGWYKKSCCWFLGDLNHTLFLVWWWKSPTGIKRQNVWMQVSKCSICLILVMFGFFCSLLGCSWCTKYQKNKFLILHVFMAKKPIWLTWWNLGMAV